MAPSQWTAALAALLGLSALWSAGCSADLPPDPADYEVVATKKKGDKGASEAAEAREEAPSSDESDRAGPVPSVVGGAADGPAGADADEKPPAENTLLLDGKPMTITAAEAHVNRYGAFFTVDFNGANAPAKTQIILNFQKVGSGCVGGADAQQLFLYPAGSSSDAYRSKDEPACGLEITAFPSAVGDVAAGTFKGTLQGMNGQAGKTRTLEMTFHVKSVEQP